MKRGLLGFPLLIFLIQVVSAQFFSGYGGFSITGFFNSIDSETMTLGLLFFIFFALIFYATSKVFKDSYGQPNKGVAGTISLAVSLLIVYGIYRSGFNIGDLFYNLGIGTEILYLIGSIIFIVLAIFLIKKIRFHGFLMVFGLLLILLTAFTDIFYEKGLVVVIGLVLFLIGLLLWRRGRKVMGTVGRGAWKVGRGIGKGVGKGVTTARQYRDPRYKFMKYEKKREALEQKGLSRRALARAKVDYKEEKRRQPRPIREFAQKEWQKEKDVMQERRFKGAEKAAHKENARREKEMRRQQEEQVKRQQAQQQIQQINNEIARLQQMIPSASVIERGKIEDQIRAYKKRAKKLR